MKILIKASCIILTICFAIFSSKSFFADIHIKQSLETFKLGKMQDALVHADTAIKLNPYEPSYKLQKARILAISSKYEENPKDKKTLANLAFTEIIKSYEYNNKNLATIRNSLPILTIIIEQEPTLLSSAHTYLNSFKNSYKNDVGVLIDIYKVEKNLNLNSNDQTLKRIEFLRPDLIEWYIPKI
jgi:hypothetical protein